MTSLFSSLKGIVKTFKNFVSRSDAETPSTEGVYYPPSNHHYQNNHRSSYFGTGIPPPYYAKNNYTNNSSSHRNPPSTLHTSYYVGNNHHRPPTPKLAPANNSHSYSISGATAYGGLPVLSSFLENNNCRKRSADFAFKNDYHYLSQNSHKTSYSRNATGADLVQHLTDDEDEDVDFAKPAPKRFSASFSKLSSWFPTTSNNISGPGTSSFSKTTTTSNHIRFNNLNNLSAFGVGSSAPSSTSMNRPLTRFTTAPKYQKKTPRKEPECITISSDDDVDDVPELPRSVALPQLRSKNAATPVMSNPFTLTKASTAEPARVPRLYSTPARNSPGQIKRMSMPVVNHVSATNSSYTMKTMVRQRSPPPPVSTNLRGRTFRHSIGANHSGRTVLIGDSDDEDDSEAGVGSGLGLADVEMEVTKVDKGCGPDDEEDPLKKRTERLYGRPTSTPVNQRAMWAGLNGRDPPSLRKPLLNGPAGGRNGETYAFGALTRSRISRTSSVASDTSNGVGDSAKATGSRGSSSSFSSSTSGRRGSAISSPKSPISMSTDSDGKFHDEIQILSETILSPNERRDPYAVNSLEIEFGQADYRDKEWLKKKRLTLASLFSDKVKEYQDKGDHNRSQIEYEHKKIDILKHESTLNTDIEERIRRQLTITDVITLEPVPAAMPEITEEMREVINNALNLRNDKEVLVSAFNIQITRADLKTLKPCQWLNDNVINTYMDMIAERSRKTSGLPSVYVFTTFFYPKFQKEGYSNILKRWTRKVDIFSFDLLIFPIHLGVHWCLAAADLRNNRITFYDSLLGSHMHIAKALLKYLASEMMERKKEELNVNQWKLEVPRDIPTQENGSDCGVFSCKFAEYVSRDARLTFKQENMNYYRLRMVYEIVKQDLMHP